MWLMHLSPEVAGHLVVAIRTHRERCVRDNIQLPQALRDLEQSLRIRAMRGQEGSPLADLWEVVQSSSMRQQLLSFDDTAAVLACSKSALKRLVADGALAPVRVGAGIVRFRATDIDAYVAALPTNHGAGTPARSHARSVA